ncbi:MAG: hypothetical protein AUJ23_03080 [Candidatus Magasanikbacteria bacterium CG1_02_32_51]|uniref:Cold-shock protein n=2 Tax=Candidatus Magasanikiibacteriota TaxID=1752731 RepID=A0A1J4U883_9BACT|nr:MAG: hypothetical protein AUJ23_03080 [Candidatus Magasanikbacteria bacterium CG1_02_32_51]
MFKLSNFQSTILAYFVLINFITFITFGIDKGKAINNNRRVSEKTLWVMSLLGGSLGALLAMKTFRHKTKKLSFQVVLALILALQVLLIYLILK